MRFQGLKWWIIALLLASVATLSYGQSARSLRINEVVLNNRTGLVDEYGKQKAWLEIHNPSAATINLGGLYLTDDINQPQKYPIRTGNLITKLPPYQSFVIYLDGQSVLGTMHSDMVLDPTQENTIYLFDSDGRLLIDQVTVPAMVADESYARMGESLWSVMSTPTPGETNEYTHGRQSVAQFKTNDPLGFVMTLIAVPVVFIALIILFIVFNFIGKYNTKRVKEKASQTTGKSIEEIEKTVDLPAEVYAAIAMALYELQRNVHDEEDTVITISNPSRRYSPWNSKIHTLRQTPDLKRR